MEKANETVVVFVKIVLIRFLTYSLLYYRFIICIALRLLTLTFKKKQLIKLNSQLRKPGITVMWIWREMYLIVYLIIIFPSDMYGEIVFGLEIYS